MIKIHHKSQMFFHGYFNVLEITCNATHTELSYFNEVTMWIASLYFIQETMYFLHVKSS